MSIWLNPLVWFVEKTLNPLLQSDHQNRHLISQLKGKRILFRCTDLALTVIMDVTHDGKLHLFSDDAHTPVDLELSGTKSQWVTQATSVNATQLLVDMKGDVQIAAKLHELMQAFDIDWGALFEPYVGSQVSQVSHLLLKVLHKQSARMLQSLKMSTQEYIQHEGHVSVSPYEAQHFYAEVDKLSARVDRLTARVQRQRTQKNHLG